MGPPPATQYLLLELWSIWRLHQQSRVHDAAGGIVSSILSSVLFAMHSLRCMPYALVLYVYYVQRHTNSLMDGLDWADGTASRDELVNVSELQAAYVITNMLSCGQPRRVGVRVRAAGSIAALCIGE